LEKAVCDAMTTGETFFFRDDAPFDFLRMIIPGLAERCRGERRSLRIWSAAAATGQEPYSVAMLIEELSALLRGVRVELFATDFATSAINRAQRGMYSLLEVQRGLAPELLERYFTEHNGSYVVTNTLRQKIVFAECNLLDTFDALGKFDIILCRNVLLYFDAATKKDVMERMASVLVPGGYFFLGSTETSFGVTDRLVRVPDVATPVHVRAEEGVTGRRSGPPRHTRSVV
jgi:chemotaxis protein methyltransferase CheR